MPGVRWAASVIAGAVVLAACSASPSPSVTSPSADTSPPSVAPTGGTAFPRTLQADRMVEVQVETPGEQRGIVVSVALDSPFFGPSGTVPTNVLLEPGWLARLRVPLGPALCPAAMGESIATVEVRAYEGVDLATREVVLDDVALAEINASECRQRVATDAAAPSFASAPTLDGDRLETAVVLQRGPSAAPATLTSLSSNVIFTLETAPETLPVTLASVQDRVAVPVVITASRCDAHAFAESKKTFVFRATYDVEGEEISVEYLAEGATREALQQLFDECAVASDADGIGGG